MADGKIGIHCTAVPDGISANGKARLSLVLTPDLRSNAPGALVPIEDWPNQIAQCAGNKQLRIYFRGPGGSDHEPIRFVFPNSDPAVANGKEASVQWNKIFGLFNGFDALMAVLSADVPKGPDTTALAAVARMKGDQFSSSSRVVLDALAHARVSVGRFSIAFDALNWSQTRYLDEAINAFHDDSHFLRLFALIAAHELRANGPNYDLMPLANAYKEQAEKILGPDAVGWVNSIATAFLDRPFRQRVLASVHDSVLNQLLEAGIGNPPGDAFGLLERLAPPKRSEGTVKNLKDSRLDAIEAILRKLLVPDHPYRSDELTTFASGRGGGQEMMRALFQEAALQHTKGPDLRTPMQLQARVRTVVEASNNFEAFRQHWRNSAVVMPESDRDVTDQQRNAATRKFFGIRALPMLAKFLRLTVDVELDLEGYKLTDDINGKKSYDCFGAMFVEKSDDDTAFADLGQPPDLTGFEQFKSAPYSFRPASCHTHRFGPNAPDLKKTAAPITNGVLNLRVADSDGSDPRFLISILDLPAGINSLRMKAEQDSGAQRSGTLLHGISTKTPERQSRGLQLVDTMAIEETTATLLRGRYALSDQPLPGSPTRPYFAEDLVIGYRPYIQRWKHDAAPTGGPWRSLVARKVSIKQIVQFVRGDAYQSLQTRDHGYVQSAHKMQDNTETSGPPPAAPPPSGTTPPAPPALATTSAAPTTDGQMLAWMGGSLGLPTGLDAYVDQKSPAPGEDPNNDLALDIAYDFSDKPSDLQPALRVGDSYKMGLTPVYPNCGGPTSAEIQAAFKATDANVVTLGDDRGGAFKFGPPRDIPAPGLLISEAEAKQWKDTEQAKGVGRGNAENVVRIVLRTATKPANNKDSVKRYLVPPRASFEVAEQSGLFDHDFETTPGGAFADYEQDPEHGGFTSDEPSQKDSSPQKGSSRSAVLRPISPSHQPEARYYPDPLARNLKVAFERNGATPEGFPDTVPLHAFWKQDGSPISAKPIELLIKRWADGLEGGQVDFSDTAGKVSGKFGASRTLDRLSVEIAPAEEVSLRFWCVPDRPDFLRSHTVFGTHFQRAAQGMATTELSRSGSTLRWVEPLGTCVELLGNGVSAEQIKKLGTNPPDLPNVLPVVDGIFEKIFSALTSQTPDNGVNAWLEFDVVHAVEKPLAIPAIPLVKQNRVIDGNPCLVPVLTVHPVRIQHNTTWDQYASPLDPSDPAEALNFPSQENGTTTYLLGQIDFDRASTGEFRIEASWPETDPASTIQVVDPPNGSSTNASKTYKLKPPQKDRLLFSFSVPRDRGLNPQGKLDLTFDETGVLRGLNYPFTDTTAREISLRLVATSRFANDFPVPPAPPGPPPPPDPYALGRFEVESRPPVGSERLKKAEKTAPESYQIYKIVVPASATPSSPTISRLEWVTPETLTEFDPGRRVCVEKSFYPRLYLGQDWCGFDELLAVICAPEDLVSYRPYSADLAAPSALEPIPLSVSEVLNAPAQRKIAAWDFGDGPPDALQAQKYYPIAEYVSRWGSDPTTHSGPLTGIITRERFSGFIASKPKVALPGIDPAQSTFSILLYKPVFDCNAGEFYVDIGIDPGAAHSPMVELVVARYQPHVIDKKFHLSAATRVQPFQVAPKRKVEILIRDDRNVTAIVQGVGYTDRIPEVPPTFNGTLPDEYASRIRYPLQNIRVISLNDNNSTTGIQVHNESGQPLLFTRTAPQFYHPELIWISEFRLPLPRSRYHYGLQIDEIDLHFADEAYEPNAIPGRHIVERPSNFSLTIDFERGLYLTKGDGNGIAVRG